MFWFQAQTPLHDSRACLYHQQTCRRQVGNGAPLASSIDSSLRRGMNQPMNDAVLGSESLHRQARLVCMASRWSRMGVRAGELPTLPTRDSAHRRTTTAPAITYGSEALLRRPPPIAENLVRWTLAPVCACVCCWRRVGQGGVDGLSGTAAMECRSCLVSRRLLKPQATVD